MATAIRNRYASAVNARSLVVDERTTMSDSDVLGAMGLADRRLTEGFVRTGPGEGYPTKPAPLAVPLERLFAGDNKAARDIVGLLANMAFQHSFKMRVKIAPSESFDMARMCLAWYRDGRCRPCGGHGYKIIPGTVTLGVDTCDHCRGVGKIPFEEQFPDAHQMLARWVMAEMERASGRAGEAAMKALAPRLDL
jgi:hypothetical protein